MVFLTLLCRCQNTIKLLLKYHQIKFASGRPCRSRAMFLIKMAIGDFLRDCCPVEVINEMNLELESEGIGTGTGGAKEGEGESLKEEGNSTSATDPTSETGFESLGSESLFVDEDDSIPGVSHLYRSFSAQLKYLHSCFNGIIKMGSSPASNGHGHGKNNATMAASATSLNTLNTPSKSHLSTINNNTSTGNETPRKIRPITQVAASELRHQRLQKQLRQWFWWRYGSQRVLVDALVSYILEQKVFPRYPKTATTLLVRNQVSSRRRKRE